MFRLLENFWDHQQVVSIQNGYHGLAFQDTWGTSQGGLLSQTLFNVVGDNFIRTWLAMTVEDQRVDHDGLGETVRRCLGVSYTGDGMFASRETDWMHHLMNVLVSHL